MKTIVLLFFLLWAGTVCAQKESEEYKKTIEKLNFLAKTDSIYVQEKTHLVSGYTFTQMVKKGFAQLVTGSAENNQVGKYAALSVDRNEQSFSFSPINYIVNGNDATKPFKHILAVNANGKLNNNGFFDFSDRKKLQIGGSWTALWYSIHDFPKNQIKNFKIYRLAKNKIIEKMETKDSLEIIRNKSMDVKDYEMLYHQEVEKTESELYKNVWTAKFLAWTKLDVGYGEDRLKIIDSTNVQSSVHEPINKNISGGYFSLSGNLFYGLKNGFGVYLNVQLSYSKKTSLSEIFSTVEWNKIQYNNGTNHTVYYNMDEQNVYITNISTFEKRYKRDISVQILSFFPIGQQNLIGLDLSYQNKEFLTPGSKTFTSNKNILSIGIMFPLRDKDGKTTINIEPFWRTTSFSNYDEGKDESFWGVKFGVPLNQIF